MKAIITTVAIFILSSVSCNCEVPRQIMLGFPLEQYELFDRVQECRDEVLHLMKVRGIGFQDCGCKLSKDVSIQ